MHISCQSSIAETVELVSLGPGWAGKLCAFDRENFGVDAWPLSVWEGISRDAWWANPKNLWPLQPPYPSVFAGAFVEKPSMNSRVQQASIVESYPPLAALVVANMGIEAEIATIAVGRQHRRSGLGSVAMKLAICAAKQCGGEDLFLEVRARDEGAQNFYRTFGFEKVGVREGYYHDDDAVLMHLCLVQGEVRS